MKYDKMWSWSNHMDISCSKRSWLSNHSYANNTTVIDLIFITSQCMISYHIKSYLTSSFHLTVFHYTLQLRVVLYINEWLGTIPSIEITFGLTIIDLTWLDYVAILILLLWCYEYQINNGSIVSITWYKRQDDVM